jgi:hypothetical protein
MKIYIILFYLLLASKIFADSLRISEVTSYKAADSIEFVYDVNGVKNTVYISNKILVSDGDILRATALVEERKINIFLRDEAAARFRNQTAIIAENHGKIAVLINNEIINIIPIKQAIENNFSIIGANIKNPNDLSVLARKLTLKNEINTHDGNSTDNKINNNKNNENIVSNIKIIRPAVDKNKNDKDLVGFTESIRILNIQDKISQSDLLHILSLIVIMEQTIAQNEKTTATINAECDIVKLLRTKIFEIDDLIKKNNDARIKIHLLYTIADFYMKNPHKLPTN